MLHVYYFLDNTYVAAGGVWVNLRQTTHLFGAANLHVSQRRRHVHCMLPADWMYDLSPFWDAPDLHEGVHEGENA